MARLVAGAIRRPALAARVATSPSTPLRLPTGITKRLVSTSWITKKKAAEDDWNLQAIDIKAGRKQNPYDFLKERGFIHDTAGAEKQIRELFRTRRIGVYAGVDPTADSLHIGHLLPFMVIFWMWMQGFQAITLIGGSTARIGDPIGRTEARPSMTNADISKNITKMHYQLKRLWTNVEELARKHGHSPHWGGTHRLVNNNTWFQGLSVYEMMKRLGRHVRLGPMLSRDWVKNRLESGEGMSFGELMYPLFQGWDFWQLYSKLGVQLQVGGSDQYGNLVQGIEAVKMIRSTEEAPAMRLPEGWANDPYGLTVPLLTDLSGAKLGKSADNAIWLDPFKTPSFDLYGYFVRCKDTDVGRYLGLFTFLPAATIEEAMAEHEKAPHKRVAHHLLAFEVLSLVHGPEIAIREQQQHMMLLGKSDAESRKLVAKFQSVATTEYENIVLGTEVRPPMLPAVITPNNAPRIDIKLPKSAVMGASVASIVYAAGLTQSKADSQRLIKADGIYIAAAPGAQKRGLLPGNLDWTPVKLWFPEEVAKFVIDEKLLILRRGKHHVRCIEIVSDEEYAESGQQYPGQPHTGKFRSVIRGMIDEAEKAGVKLNQIDIKRHMDKKNIHQRAAREEWEAHGANSKKLRSVLELSKEEEEEGEEEEKKW